jgi:DnaJ-class molecular chaperone
MKDYYEILDISLDASEDEIYDAYNKKIVQFKHLPFFTNQMIKEIKLLKEAIYVLGDENKRYKYNILIEQLNNKKQYEEEGRHIDNTKVYDRLFSIKFDN